MTFSHTTHHMGRLEGTQRSAVVRTTPIIRISLGAETLYLQNGQVFDPDGKPIEPVPGWLEGEMTKLTDAALASVGFKRPTAIPQKQEEPKIEMWTCPECHKMMDERNREPHIAKHNRHKAPDAQMPNTK